MTLNDFELLIRYTGIQLNCQIVKEYKFLPKRRFRFDYAIPSKMIAIEYEGGIWTKGRHTRATGYANDCEKYNLAALDGWKVFRFTSENLKDSESTIKFFDQIIERFRGK